MDTTVLQLPFLHETTFVAPGNRTPDTRMARARADFRVPSGTSGDFPVSAVLIRPGKPPVPTYVVEGRAYNVVEVDVPRGVDDYNDDDLRLPLPKLLGLDRVAVIPRRFHDADTEEGIHATAVRFTRRSGSVRRVGDQRDMRHAEAALAYAGFVLLVDGEVLTNGRGHEPCWEVVRTGNAVRMDARMDPTFDPEVAYFSADRETEASDFARSLARAAGVPLRRSSAGIRVVDAGLLRFDEAKAIARSLATAYARAIDAMPEAVGLYRGGERRFPDLHGRPKRWTGELNEAALDLRRLSGFHPYAMDRRWTADVLRAYGTLADGADRSGAQVRAYVERAIGTGRACHARWTSIRHMHAEVDAMANGREAVETEGVDEDEEIAARLG